MIFDLSTELQTLTGEPPFPFAGGWAAVCPDDPDAQYELVHALRAKFAGENVAVFASLEPVPPRAFGLTQRRPLVAALPYANPFDVLRACGTSGGDALPTEALIRVLADWQARHPFTVYGADRDWVALEFDVPTDDALTFASEIIAFCPDVLDEDTPTPQALADDLRETRRLFLWWD